MKLHQFLVFSLFLLSATSVLSQTYTTEKTTSGKAKKLYDKALELSRATQLPEALEAVEKSLVADPKSKRCSALRIFVDANHECSLRCSAPEQPTMS